MSFIKASGIRKFNVHGFSPIDDSLGGLNSGSSYIIFGDAAELAMYSYMTSVANLGPVLYINSTDYYSERNLIDQETIGSLSKASGLDPDSVLDRIYEVSAHSPERLALAVKTHLRPGFSLYVLHGLNSFIDDKKSSDEAYAKILRTAVSSNAPFLSVTKGEKDPIATDFMISSANYIIGLWSEESGISLEVLKPFQFQKSYGWDKMGRLTKPFRERYEEYLAFLEKEFEPLLRGETKESFEELKKLWSSEIASMSSLMTAQVSDAMTFVAIIRLMQEVEKLKKEIKNNKK
ncbi:MAG: hypothetical protein ACP5LF_03845 [Nitrososphaeria archaeon]|nr:hypothetical protein [Conexivisphaerales archaeon]